MRAQTCYRANFFYHFIGIEIYVGLPKESSRPNQPLLSNLLETISPLKMPIIKFAVELQWYDNGIAKNKVCVPNISEQNVNCFICG